MDDPLDGLALPFRDRCRRIALRSRAVNVPIRWTSGLRTWEEQNRLWRQGRDDLGYVVNPSAVVTHAMSGESWHNYGLAADFVLLRPDGSGVEWSTLADLDGDGLVDWQEVGRIAEAEGCVWGGRWRSFMDAPHIEYHPHLTIRDARTIYATRGLDAVWAHVADTEDS